MISAVCLDILSGITKKPFTMRAENHIKRLKKFSIFNFRNVNRSVDVYSPEIAVRHMDLSSDGTSRAICICPILSCGQTKN